MQGKTVRHEGMFSELLFLQSPPREKRPRTMSSSIASPPTSSLRPNTNSTGTNASSSSRRNASLQSFPSRHSRGSNGTPDDDFTNPNKGPRITHLAPAPQLPHVSKRRPAPVGVKSQYPATGLESERHVEYILVASFDIDRGSVMEHQYPAAVSGDEHMLADLMLPDQAHVRSQDWTVFFLHKDGTPEEEEEEGQNGAGRRKRRKERRRDGQASAGAGAEEGGGRVTGSDEGSSEDDDEEDDDDDEENPDGPPLVYVLNLVNTKQDNTAKRGAVVKAMAICTRHSFLHIYKPLLLLALEQYFAHPALETLAGLYHAVNAMDLSLMPRLTYHEKFILQSSDAKDLFLEKFDALLAQRMATDNASSPDNTSAAPSPRGRFGLPRDTHEFESVVRYANVPVPVKVPVALFPETVGDFSLVKLITTFSKPHAASPQPFNPTHPHLTTAGGLTHPIIVLLNALLTQKRIIFLGHNLPSSEVAEAVLGACALASGGVLRGFTRHAFPYTDLTKIDDLLKVPGFIAGVTNPAFAHKTEWWDLLCDISTGRMRISSKIEQAPLTEGVAYFQNPQNINMHTGGGGGSGIAALVGAGSSLSAGLGGSVNSLPTSADATGDAAFMANVLHAIQERHGEGAVRSKFRRWVMKFIRLAASFEEVVYGATSLHIQHSTTPTTSTPHSANGSVDPSISDTAVGHGYVWPTAVAKTVELAANATRIEGWRMTRSYYNFVQDLAASYPFRPVKDVDLHHLHDKLAKLRLSGEQSAQVYTAICSSVRNDAQITHLLSTILSGTTDIAPSGGGASAGSASQGFQGQHGLFYLALGLFHPKVNVREQVADLLYRIQEHEAGRQLWSGLGRFARMAWERVMLGRRAAISGAEAEVEEAAVAGLGLTVGGAGLASRGGSVGAVSAAS